MASKKKQSSAVPAKPVGRETGGKPKISVVATTIVKQARKRKAAAAKQKEAEAKKAGAAAAKPAAAPQGRSPRLRSQPVEVQEIDVQVQRARKTRLSPYRPRSYGSRPRRIKPADALDLLVKYMGKAPVASEHQRPATVVELGIFCIFALGRNSTRASLEATRRLVAAFPEWNEFRVSEAYEFLEALDGVKLVEPYDRCEQVLEYVNEVYQDQNAVDLEFLRDLSPADRLVALNRYRSLGPSLSHYLALGLQGFDGILFHYSWARVVQRVGLIPRSGSPRVLVESLEKAFQGLDTASLQINLIDLGEAVCRPKGPHCKTCYFVMHCRSRKV